MQKKGSKFISIISMLNKTFDYHFNVFEVDEDTVHNFIKFFLALSWDYTFSCFNVFKFYTTTPYLFGVDLFVYIDIQCTSFYKFLSFIYLSIYLFILLSLFTHSFVSSFYIDIGVIYVFFYIKIYKKTKRSYYQKANKKVNSVKQRINVTQHSP